MTDKKSYAEVIAERERHPYGTPRPYTPDHPNLLEHGLSPPVGDSRFMASPGARRGLVVLAMAVAGYGAYGLAVDDVYLPRKHAPGTHYHGGAALCMVMMLVCLAAWLLAAASAKFDPRSKRISNRKLQVLALTGTVAFMVAGLVAGEVPG